MDSSLDLHINFLKALLKDVYLKRTSDFSGLGIIIYNNLENLPTSSLRENSKLNDEIYDYESIVNYLVSISSKLSDYHDGFHLISSQLHLTHVCQYFSPPIVKGIDLNFIYGGRFRAGLYGSYLEAVSLCGIASMAYSPLLFHKGLLINVEVK